MRRYFILPVLGLLAACARVDSLFIPEIVIHAAPKTECAKVEFFSQQPSRNAIRIGKLSTDGNGSSDFKDLVIQAKKEAAKLGGDFILCEESGVEKNTTYVPAHSSYDSNRNVDRDSNNGRGNSKVSAYSTGPSIVTTKLPWGVFSVWVYTPSRLGFHLDERNMIESFQLDCDAEVAGVLIGDKVIGIDGYDIGDDRTTHHLTKVRPGDKVKLTLEREGKRIERKITALPN